MKKTVSKNEFISEFEELRPDNFTSEGLSCLFDFLTELEEGGGEEFELDVIAFCCDFTEFEDLEEFNGCYADAENIYRSIDDVIEETMVIRVTDERFIIQNF